MKRIFLSLLVLVAASSYALMARPKGQTNASLEHMTFKGIPIEGKVEDMVQALRIAGCTYSGASRLTVENGEEVRIDILRGSLIGYDAVYMTLMSTMNSPNYVFQCSAAFPTPSRLRNSEKWDYMLDTYNKVCQKLSMKYGTPSEVNHNNPGRGEFLTSESTAKFFALRRGECKWRDVWKTDLGAVYLEIDYQGEFAPDDNSPAEKQYGVVLTYVDVKSKNRAYSSVLEEL